MQRRTRTCFWEKPTAKSRGSSLHPQAISPERTNPAVRISVTSPKVSSHPPNFLLLRKEKKKKGGGGERKVTLLAPPPGLSHRLAFKASFKALFALPVSRPLLPLTPLLILTWLPIASNPKTFVSKSALASWLPFKGRFLTFPAAADHTSAAPSGVPVTGFCLDLDPLRCFSFFLRGSLKAGLSQGTLSSLPQARFQSPSGLRAIPVLPYLAQGFARFPSQSVNGFSSPDSGGRRRTTHHLINTICMQMTQN